MPQLGGVGSRRRSRQRSSHGPRALGHRPPQSNALHMDRKDAMCNSNSALLPMAVSRYNLGKPVKQRRRDRCASQNGLQRPSRFFGLRILAMLNLFHPLAATCRRPLSPRSTSISHDSGSSPSKLASHRKYGARLAPSPCSTTGIAKPYPPRSPVWPFALHQQCEPLSRLPRPQLGRCRVVNRCEPNQAWWLG